MITLKLEYGMPDPEITDLNIRIEPQNRVYKVVQVIGSTQFYPGQILRKPEVSDLCAMYGVYKVIIDGEKL